MDWFNITAIEDGIYAISEPYHWEDVRSYLFIGKEKAILVDSGTGLVALKSTTDKLTNLPVSVIVTHCHWDHIGSINCYDEVYIHRDDEAWLRDGIPLPLEVIMGSISSGGYDASRCPNFNLSKYSPPTRNKYHILKGGEVISNGIHSLEVIHTPGHSPGSISLFERSLNTLVTGDLVYKGTIYAFYPSTDPQTLYESYELINKYNPQWILPGHNDDRLGGSILKEALDLLKQLDAEGKLKHGSGCHSSENISFKF